MLQVLNVNKKKQWSSSTGITLELKIYAIISRNITKMYKLPEALSVYCAAF
jgi:hypothetical protein